MKAKIHPEYKETTISCVCGEVIHTRSTKQNIHVDICSKCHPFFTGKQKLVDSAGRVERFEKRYAGKKRAPKKKADAPAAQAARPPQGPAAENAPGTVQEAPAPEKPRSAQEAPAAPPPVSETPPPAAE